MKLLAQILPPEIAALFNERTLVWVTAIWLLLQNAGRFYWAIRNGGGFISIWRGLIYGANSPKGDDKQP